MTKSLKIAFGDFLTPKFLLLSTLPLFFTTLILGIVFYFSGGEVLKLLDSAITSGDFEILRDYPVLQKILSFWLIKWLFSAIFYTLGAILTIFLSLLITLIVIGFLTPIATNWVNSKHYNLPIAVRAKFGYCARLMIREFGVFLLISLAISPLIFVPFVGFLAINIPLFYLYFKFMLIDVASNCLEMDEFEQEIKKCGGKEFILGALLCYLLCLIPFVGVFMQLFFVIFLAHILLAKKAAKFASCAPIIRPLE